MANGERESEEEEMKKIESEIEEMAGRISHYRATLLLHLLPSLASALAARRPPDLADVTQSGPSIDPNSAGGPLAEEDQETAERAKVLKQKISDNISAVPVLLKRMKDVISRLDKLDSCNSVNPPIYKKKRTN